MIQSLHAYAKASVFTSEGFFMITGTSLENLWGILAWPKASSLFTLASNESDTGLSLSVARIAG